MKGYKAFDKGLVCKGKQYAENTDFEEEGGQICGKGMMHFCPRPLDVLRFYEPVDDNGNFREFAKVEALDETVTNDNVKFATKKLHVGAKLSFGELVKASVEYDIEKAEKGNSQTGSYSGNSQTGNCSGNSQTGCCSGNSQTGRRSALKITP